MYGYDQSKLGHAECQQASAGFNHQLVKEILTSNTPGYNNQVGYFASKYGATQDKG